MEPNTRDTPLRNLTSLIIGGGLILVICILGVILYPVFNAEAKDLDDQYQDFSKLDIELMEVHEKQAELLESYKYDRNVAAKALFNKQGKN